MADQNVTPIPLCLPPAERRALACVIARLRPEDCTRLTSPCEAIDGKPAAELAWSGLLVLVGALSTAGGR